MSEPLRPHPDALLAVVGSDAATRKGRLTVFLGMAPGVGKTYAMLEAARARLASGTELLVGLVESHGRQETEALLAGLPILPRRTFAHRGVCLSEFDLDAALARRPALLVVDELAHANAPGSRHERRWQDVRELLDAGIDVLTTLNVQHVESRSGTVAEITGVAVRETVPDSLLDEAEIELVDLSPRDLRRRLDEGKVYLGSRAASATENFFREANLAALREMALRLAAEHAGHDTRHFHRASSSDGPWKSGHHLLVAVGPSPHSSDLIRWTRRFADSLACPWTAVHVETDPPLSEASQARVTSHLGLARELGGGVVVTPAPRFASGLLLAAHDINATHLVVGKPVGTWWQRIRRYLRLLRLVDACGGIDVHLVRIANPRAEETAGPPPPAAAGFLPDARARVPWSEFALATGAIAGTTLLGFALAPLLGPRALAFVFLLPVIALALVCGRAAVFLAATLGALAWNILFLPPRFDLRIESSEDFVLFAGYFVVAALLGQLVQRLRRQEQTERLRERRTRALYELNQSLAGARSRDEVVWSLLDAVGRAFLAPASVTLPRADGSWSPHPDGTLALDEKERSVAAWAAAHSRPSGRFTENLPGAGALHLPMITTRGVAGVLSLDLPGPHPLGLPQRELLDAFAQHAGLVLDRLSLQRDVEQGRLTAESDRLGRALLDCVSHELRTPLTALLTAASALASNQPHSPLIGEIGIATRRLARLVDHLLDMSRIDSGVLRPRPEWVSPADLALAVQRRVGPDLDPERWQVDIAPDLGLVWLDPRLTEQAIANLVHNACVHAAGQAIRLEARREGPELVWEVRDQGPGFPPDALARAFDKFHRADTTRAGGTGLGLAIARGFIVAQGGSIAAANGPSGGARITLRLPYRQAPPVPEASEFTAP